MPPMPVSLPNHSPTPKQGQRQDWQEQQQAHGTAELADPARIRQTSVFAMLPSELVLEIFGHLDIVTTFRFLDTCRHHRYLLLNLPEVWRKVRFIPLSEYMSLSSSSSTPLSIAATASVPAAAALSSPSSATATLTPSNTQFMKSQHRRPQRRSRPRGSSSSESETDTDDREDQGGSEDSASKQDTDGAAASANRIKHAENERDRDRGGSRTLISEIYAVLRRFRKENRLIDFVREIYMDSTDSPHFPSPLVMLIKFPNLEVLSSRYRRKQTGFTTDTHTLKDMLRNGDILPHSLKLRRWDVFHPYMIKDDVTGFKQILDAITIVGLAAAEPKTESKKPSGVLLDIRLCSESTEISPADSTTAGTGLQAGAQSVVHVGGGMHWASAANVQPSPVGDQGAAPTLQTSAPAQPCTNIVWVLEKCRVCEAPQERCWQCVGQCKACGAARAPPSINHQTALERERAKQTPLSIYSSSSSSSGAVSQAPTTGSGASTSDTVVSGRPRTPPGSISLSQLSNPQIGIRSAYLSTHQSMRHELLQASYAASNSGFGSIYAPQPVVVPATLTRPPEFSFFD